MVDARSVKSPMREGTLFGWLIVGIGFLTLALAFSGRALLGLTMPEIEQELGWTRTLVSDGGAYALIVMAVMAPIGGNLVDRLGARFLLAAGLLAVGTGLLFTGGATEPWHFFLAYSGLTAVGFGLAATHVVSTVVSHFFERSRGLAVAIATSGSTVGQLVLVPLVSLTLVWLGWRGSYVVMAIGCLVLLPLVLFMLRAEKHADNKRTTGHSPADGSLATRLRYLITNATFHKLYWSYFICGFTTTGIIETHFLPYATLCGFLPQEGALAYGFLSAVNLGGMVLFGWLTDRVNRPMLLGMIYILRGVSFILLLNMGSDISLLFGFALIFGLFDYSTISPTVSLVGSHLGLRIMGLTMGLLSSGHSMGAAVGVFLAGRIFDWSARYDWVWMVAFVLSILAGLMSFLIPENRQRGLAPAAA
jgi:MFS family permease